MAKFSRNRNNAKRNSKRRNRSRRGGLFGKKKEVTGVMGDAKPITQQRSKAWWDKKRGDATPGSLEAMAVEQNKLNESGAAGAAEMKALEGMFEQGGGGARKRKQRNSRRNRSRRGGAWPFGKKGEKEETRPPSRAQPSETGLTGMHLANLDAAMGRGEFVRGGKRRNRRGGKRTNKNRKNRNNRNNRNKKTRRQRRR